MFNQEVAELAKAIWNYHHMNHALQKADVMLVLGSHDLSVPEYAAKLYQEGYAPIVVVSGGIAHQDDLLKTNWDKTEAEIFADVLTSNGVSRQSLFLEKDARNTGENFSLSRTLLESAQVSFTSVLVVTKPYMERRAYATGAKQWPDKNIIVTSPPASFEEYFSSHLNQKITPENVLNVMIGDLQRIELYGKNGFQITQEIPQVVWDAYQQLIELGYDKHLLRIS